MIKRFLNLMSSINTEIKRTSTSHKQDKHKESYTQAHYNQIVDSIYKEKNLKSSQRKRTLSTTRKQRYCIVNFSSGTMQTVVQWHDVFSMLSKNKSMENPMSGENILRKWGQKKTYVANYFTTFKKYGRREISETYFS